MSPQDIASAITAALVQGGSQWLVSTLVAFLPVLWTMALILQIGRPYVLRTLQRCGLRLGADIWWMSYLLMRDAVILATFALSWLFFEPSLVASAALPITGSLAALCLLLALAVKLTRRADDDIAAYRLTTLFLVIGATLYYFPQVFAVEATSQTHLSWFTQYLTTNTNTTVALWLMWLSLLGVALVAVWLFVRVMQSVSRSMRPVSAPTGAPRRRPHGRVSRPDAYALSARSAAFGGATSGSATSARWHSKDAPPCRTMNRTWSR